MTIISDDKETLGQVAIPTAPVKPVHNSSDVHCAVIICL